MSMKIVVMGAALLLGSAALAADPVKLACPAGATQSLALNREAHFCVDSKGTRVDGPMAILWSSGKLQALGQTADGIKRAGKWTIYTEQGVKTAEIEFKNGDFHGKHVEFHPNGKMKKVETFHAGAKVGATQEFDLMGKAVTTVVAK